MTQTTCSCGKFGCTEGIKKTTKNKMLIMVAPDLRSLNPNRLGMRVANALASGYDVDVRQSDGKLHGKTIDGIFVDEADYVGV